MVEHRPSTFDNDIICVKPFVVNRKVFQTSGSEAGAIYTIKLFSIIRTAIINGLDPYRYIKYVLENIKSTIILLFPAMGNRPAVLYGWHFLWRGVK